MKERKEKKEISEGEGRDTLVVTCLRETRA